MYGIDILSKQGSILYDADPGIYFFAFDISVVNLFALDLVKLITGCLGLI